MHCLVWHLYAGFDLWGIRLHRFLDGKSNDVGSQAPRYGVQIENSLSFHEDGLLLDQDRKTGFGHAKIMHYVAECNLLSPPGVFSAVARQIPVHGKRLPAGQKEFKGKQVTHGDLGAV